MTNKKTAFTLSAAALLLLIIYIILLFASIAAAGKQSAGIWQITVSEIDAIIMNNKGERFRFDNLRQEQIWVLTSPDDIKYDQSIAQALPLVLVNLSAQSEIKTDDNLLLGYGLDDPIEIQLLMRGGSVNNLIVGDISASGELRYIWLNNESIYAVDAVKSSLLTLDYLSIRDRNVLGFNKTMRPGDIAAGITDIKVNNENKPELAYALACLTAESFEGIDQYDAYGLDAPRFTIQFQYKGEKKEFYIGDTLNDGELCYARTSDDSIVFTISTRGLEFIIHA